MHGIVRDTSPMFAIRQADWRFCRLAPGLNRIQIFQVRRFMTVL